MLITHRCCLFVETHFLDFRNVRGILRKKISSVVQPALGNKAFDPFHELQSQQLTHRESKADRTMQNCFICRAKRFWEKASLETI